MRHTVSVQLPLGDIVFRDATIDVFRRGVLTVTALYDGDTLAEYGPGAWLSASVSDEHGNLMVWVGAASPVHASSLGASLEARP